MTTPPKQRLTYIDWMRGLACLAMFQTHCYDSWLDDSARQTKFFKWSQIGGTLPAPLFLFLAGISFAMVTDKLRAKNTQPRKIARTTILRGAEILGPGIVIPHTGIHSRLSRRSVDRFAACRCAEHHRRLDDVHGRALLGYLGLSGELGSERDAHSKHALPPRR